MAEVNNGHEPALPTKRCPDLSTQEPPNGPNKKQKLEAKSSKGKQPPEPQEPASEYNVVQRENKLEQEEEEEEHSIGETVIDRKGKGILIEEDDDDDSDSDSDSGIGDNLSEDSDFSDDPMAEVDLDNILPSRTRRRAIQPGAYITNDLPNEDSDETDDPDA